MDVSQSCYQSDVVVLLGTFQQCIIFGGVPVCRCFTIETPTLDVRRTVAGAERLPWCCCSPYSRSHLTFGQFNLEPQHDSIEQAKLRSFIVLWCLFFFFEDK